MQQGVSGGIATTCNGMLEHLAKEKSSGMEAKERVDHPTTKRGIP